MNRDPDNLTLIRESLKGHGIQPYYEEEAGALYKTDCLKGMAVMPDNGIDTVITDSPYGLKFMGKEWDHGVPGIPYWKEALRVSKPGAMLMAFGGTRTHHRLACAIEDAGWEIRDAMAIFWIYGSGFPKSLDISKAIDKAAGIEREITGKHILDVGIQGGSMHAGRTSIIIEADKTVATTDLAKLWDGWGTALKPSYEIIVLAMKPLEGSFAQNAEKWGVAGLWIDGGRIRGTPRNPGFVNPAANSRPMMGTPNDKLIGYVSPKGRWPSNVLFQHHPECVCVGVKSVKGHQGHPTKVLTGLRPDTKVLGRGKGTYDVKGHTDPDGTETVPDWRCHPECPVRMLDEQSGELKSPDPYLYNGKPEPSEHIYGQGLGWGYGHRSEKGDTGGASRFFYCAKAPRNERFFLCRICDSIHPAKDRDAHWHGQVDKKGRKTWKHISQHPTQKPLKIMEYLCRLTATPTGGIVLDPFCGTGTTCIAAKRMGRAFVGMEIDAETCRVAQHRLRIMQPELWFAEARPKERRVK